MRERIFTILLVVLYALFVLFVFARYMAHRQDKERIKTLEQKVELLEEAQYQ